MDINHISVSRKKTFDCCPQQYKYRYHLKIPSPTAEPIYFIYGTLVHKIAEEYVRNSGKINIGDLAQDILRGKIEVEDGVKCPALPTDYLRKLQKHLRAIQNLTERIGVDGIVEHPFYYDLDPPNGRHVKGFIDRLIVRGEKAFILDYKTTKKGKWRVDSNTVKTDLQLRMYARVVQREFELKAENIKAALFYLEGENLVACQYSEQSLLDVEKELREAFVLIENSNPDHVWGRVGWHCKNCEYSTICQFYQPQSTEQAAWDGSMDGLGYSTF